MDNAKEEKKEERKNRRKKTAGIGGWMGRGRKGTGVYETKGG